MFTRGYLWRISRCKTWAPLADEHVTGVFRKRSLLHWDWTHPKNQGSQGSKSPDIDQIWTIYGSYIWDWIIPTHPNLCDFHQKKSNPSVLVGVSHPSLSRGRRSGNAEGCALKWWEKTWGFLWGETVEFKQKTWKDMERSWLVGGAISP